MGLLDPPASVVSSGASLTIPGPTGDTGRAGKMLTMTAGVPTWTSIAVPPIATDNFNRADGGLGAPWANSNPGTPWAIATNVAKQLNVVGNGSFIERPVGNGAVTVSADIKPVSVNSWAAIIVGDGTLRIAIEYQMDSGGALSFRKINADGTYGSASGLPNGLRTINVNVQFHLELTVTDTQAVAVLDGGSPLTWNIPVDNRLAMSNRSGGLWTYVASGGSYASPEFDNFLVVTP